MQSVEANLFKGLVLRASASWYYFSYCRKNMRKDYETVSGQWDRTRSTSASYSRQFSQTYNAVLDYTTTFATSHNLNVMLGSEFMISIITVSQHPVLVPLPMILKN